MAEAVRVRTKTKSKNRKVTVTSEEDILNLPDVPISTPNDIADIGPNVESPSTKDIDNVRTQVDSGSDLHIGHSPDNLSVGCDPHPNVVEKGGCDEGLPSEAHLQSSVINVPDTTEPSPVIISSEHDVVDEPDQPESESHVCQQSPTGHADTAEAGVQEADKASSGESVTPSDQDVIVSSAPPLISDPDETTAVLESPITQADTEQLADYISRTEPTQSDVSSIVVSSAPPLPSGVAEANIAHQSPIPDIQGSECDLPVPHASLSAVHHGRLRGGLYPNLQELVLPYTNTPAVRERSRSGHCEDELTLPLPLTEEQLRSIYFNHQLEHHDEFVDHFLKSMNQDRHPFYEIMLSYYRACNHLAGAEQDLAVLEKDYLRYKDLVWEMKEEIAVVQGQCEDKNRVSAEHKFTIAVFNEASCQDVCRALKNIRCQIQDHLSLYAYEVQLARQQVESYLNDMFQSNHALRDIPKAAPVCAKLAHQREAAVTKQVEVLKTCVAILFMFQRKPAKDHSFVQDTQQWLTMLVGCLLRVATLEDHLFIIHHLMRCPPGVGSWGACFVQVLTPSGNSGETCWDSPLVDSLVTLLAAILNPVKSREEVLYQMKVALTPPADTQTTNPWIFVDLDGEEDELGENFWWRLNENDVVALLGQLPLHMGFGHIFNVPSIDVTTENYDSSTVYSEAGFYKVIAYGTCLLKLLGNGLKTFSLVRYRQLNKRIAGLIRHTVRYITDYWETFQEHNTCLNQETQQKLSVELDQFVFRATKYILAAQRLGSWQFLTDMPFNCLSHTMMWKLLLLMHQGSSCHDNSDVSQPLVADGSRPYTFVGLDQRPSPVQYKALIQDEGSQAWFETQLTAMPTNEATFLLTTFANMAKSRPDSNHDLIETITREIFEIAYLWSHTRELCSKPGRQLLASIMTSHPWIMSLLLEAVNQQMHKIGKVSVYLFKELPIHLCQLVSADLALLREWLLEFPLASPHCHLARVVLQKMAWNHCQGSHLFLEADVHRKVAVLVMEAYSKHLHGKVIAGIFTDGLEQVSELSEEQQLAAWAWRLCLRLRLHAHSHPLLANQPPADIDGNPDLLPVVQGLRDNYALAAYLALVMGKTGHDTVALCADGVKMLLELADKSHYIPLLQVLLLTLPLFYHNPQVLVTHKTFQDLLQNLMAVDSQRKGYFSWEFPGPITHLVAAMVQSCIADAHGIAILFWLEILTSLPNWIRDRNVLYIIDSLVQAAYLDQDTFGAVGKFFMNLHETMLGETKDKGVISALFSWLASSAFPSLTPAQSSPETPWFAYIVLQTETQWQAQRGVWIGLQRALLDDPNPNMDYILKKILMGLKLDPLLSPQRLAIYRWAYQALDTNFTHPLLPLIWQQFFVQYLGRCTPEPGLPQRGSVGEKFFQSTANVTLLKRLKKRLEETAAHFHQLAVAPPAGGSDGGLDSSQESGASDDKDAATHAQRAGHYRSMVGFYQTLLFWLDEPRLHEANLYLPALPAQYDPQRLVTVFHVDFTPWVDLVNTETIKEEVKKWRADWCCTQAFEISDASRSAPLGDEDNMTATERIILRINRQHAPLAPPPVDRPNPSLPPIDESLLTRQQTLIHSLRSDFNALVDYAKLYSMRVSAHVALDMSYLELFPDLYTNEMTESVLTAQCKSTFSLTHKCKGAAVIHARHQERKRNDVVNRKMDENRAEYKQLKIECCLPPSQSVCAGAVQVENTITTLINQMKACGDPVKKAAIREVGTALFYHVATFVSEDTKYYPPTRQFFAFCIEILGQEFIRNNPTQAQPLLQAILQMPDLTGLLSPNFSPNANAELFVSMYEDMIDVPQQQGADVAFTLLTKFDVHGWLSKSNPSLTRCSALIEVLGKALYKCGKEPPDELTLVFQVYRRHLQHLVQHKFPDHFGEVLKLIMRGCEQSCISSLVLDDFLSCLGVREGSTGKFEIGDKKFTQIQAQLTHSKLTETIDWLATYFMRLRLETSEAAGFGLYPKWKSYVDGLGPFFGFLVNNSVTTKVAIVKTKSRDAEQAIHDLWDEQLRLFAPWIHPIEYNGHLISPCILSDIDSAAAMMTPWLQAVQHTQLSFEDIVSPFSQSILSLLWPFYVNHLIYKNIPDHILTMYHTALSQMPWHKFIPNMANIELMIKIRVGDFPESCCTFLGEFVTVLHWPYIVQHYSTSEISDIVCKLHALLFNLLVQLSTQQHTVEKTSLPQLIVAAESFNWNYLDSSNYDKAVSWFVDHCEPTSVLLDATQPMARILSLFKAAAGMVVLPNAVFHPETPRKRCSYVRCLVNMIGKCSHLKTVNTEDFRGVVTSLINAIEATAGSVHNACQQKVEALSLCQEVLSFLNTCNPQGGSSQVILTSILDWLGSSPSTLLLLPLLTAACRGLVSHAHMALVIEACIESHFSLHGITQTEGCGWAALLCAIEIPEMGRNKFLSEAVAQASYLTCYTWSLHQLPLSKSLNDERSVMDKLVEWTIEAKPSSSSHEAKLLLWLGKILEVMLRQLDYGTDIRIVVSTILRLVPPLVSLGEDRASAGIMGAIGFGKKSPLSIQMRLLCRAMAAYLAAQVPNDTSLRHQPGAPGALMPLNRKHQAKQTPAPSQSAIQNLAQLDALRHNKSYSLLAEHILFAINFVTTTANTIRDAPFLLKDLGDKLFPGLPYLAILCQRPS